VKLASVRHDGRDLVVAELAPDTLVDVSELLTAGVRGDRSSTAASVGTMLDVIASGAYLMRELEAALAGARANSSSLRTIAADAVTWYPPVRAPSKICAVAMNNSASNERKISAPDHPAFFLKPASCLVGHLEPIRIRRYYGSVHPEPELAAVIGRKTRDVAAHDALDAIFGYSIFDDVTSNGMRAEDRFHYWAVYAKPGGASDTERVVQHVSYSARYKGSDTFGVLGPWLVTRNDVADPDDLDVRCSVGGETVADDSTRYYNYKVAEVVSFISQFHTLDAGDIVAFGTAFKPGATRKSIHSANLQEVTGPIEIAIEGLGMQRNPVVIEDRPLGAWRLSSKTPNGEH
jgi:2-keto-4-pentenoate hydratase/2-oxohepta-3-ene-1,7-dioic acid hydratase in catechol pathway